MSSQFRANRKLERRLRKEAKGGVVIINLISMIDMFTALVFFLLIISSSVVSLRNPNSVTLPDSVAMEMPTDAPVLIVTRSQILLQGNPVMSVADAQHTAGEILAPLRAQLLAVPVKKVTVGDSSKESRGRVNIMADKSTPYSLLKKVMTTCGDIHFTDISLSVNHVPRHRS